MTSLFLGVADAVCKRLEIDNLNHRKNLKAHRTTPPGADMGRHVAETVYDVVSRNVADLIRDIDNSAGEVQSKGATIRRRRAGLGSAKNWRMGSTEVKCDDKNRWREVGLERAIVEAYGGRGNHYWWNQVPVASGLYGGIAGKRRAIDLVHRRGALAYDIVELKLDSNTPLYGAVEVLEYGFAWLLSRENALKFGYGAPDIKTSLLAANDIQLSVLAPSEFYGTADYDTFGIGINQALREIGLKHKAHLGFSGFKALSIQWKEKRPHSDLKDKLDEIYPNR